MLRWKSAAPSLLLAFAFLFACNNVDGNSITTGIKAKMFSEPLLKFATVDVSTQNGIVTITGIVPDNNARLAAESIASGTKGVKQVIDSTTVAAPPPQVAEAAAAPAPASEPAPAAPPRKKEKPARPATAPDTSADNTDFSAPALPPAPATPAVDATPALPLAPAPPPPPQPVTMTIPDGSIFTVRTTDSIDSNTASTGQSFRASLDAPAVVGDQVVLPKGLNVKLKLVQASSAGKFSGTSELTVSLDSLTYQGKTYTLSCADVQEKGGSRAKRSTAVIGGGAALGALIGGLAGGGKGAAIGAGVGAGSGTAVQAMTKGEQVKIPSETRLDFTLHAPVAITFLPNKKAVQTAPTTPHSDQPTAASQQP